MSRVSRTTFEKKQIRSLLSGEGIAEGDVADGFVPCGQFNAFIHNAEVVVEPSGGRVVWTAEQEGTIVVRDIHGQKVRGKNDFIQAFGQSFPKCLLQVGVEVWVGYSDGHMRTFNVVTLEMTFEKKRHSGAINTLVATADKKFIFSGSDDFRIILWSCVQGEDATLDPKGFVAHLPGHANRIHGLAIYGDFLFSGGDDGFVKCWKISERAEVTLRSYPLHCHKSGVKALAIFDNVLFTAGRGGVSLWNIDTCAKLHHFECLPSVTTIAIVESEVALWACTSEGRILVWDLFTYELIGEIHAHATTGVKEVKPVSRSVCSRIFATDGREVEVVYTESDGVRQGHDPMPEDLVRMHEHIDDLRQETLENQKALKAREEHMRKIEALDDHRKAMITEALHAAMGQSLKRSYFDKALTFLRRSQNQRRRKTLAHAMAANTAHGLRFLYFTKWAKFFRHRKDVRQRQALVHSLLMNTQRGLQSLYLRQAIAYVRLKGGEEAKLMAVEAMMAATTRGMTAVYFFKLRRFMFRQKQLNKRKDAVCTVLRTTENGIRRIYYAKLLEFARRSQLHRVRVAATEMLLKNTERGLMTVTFHRMAAAVKARQIRKRRDRLVSCMARSCDETLRRLYFCKLLGYMKTRKEATLEERLAELDSTIAKLQQAVSDPNILPEAEADRQIADLEKAARELEAEVEELQSSVDELTAKKQSLEAQLAEAMEVDESKPLASQVEQGVALLKGAGLNCKDNFDLVADVHRRITALRKAPSPATVFDEGIERARAALAPLVSEGRSIDADPNGLWPLDGDMVNKVTRLGVRRILAGVREAVVAWDHLKLRKLDPAQLKTSLAFLRNCTWFMQLVSREKALLAAEEEAVRAAAVKPRVTTKPALPSAAKAPTAAAANKGVASIAKTAVKTVAAAVTTAKVPPPAKPTAAKKSPPLPSTATTTTAAGSKKPAVPAAVGVAAAASQPQPRAARPTTAAAKVAPKTAAPAASKPPAKYSRSPPRGVA